MDARQVVEEFGAAWARHDLEATMALVTEDCVFDATGPAPDGTRIVGRTAVREAWRPIFEDDSSTFEVEDSVVAGANVVQRWRYAWEGGHVRGVDLFVVRGDLVAEKSSYVKG